MINICQGKDPKQMRVLEIGCGAGRVTRALASVFGEVYAVDISGEMVRQARAGSCRPCLTSTSNKTTARIFLSSATSGSTSHSRRSSSSTSRAGTSLRAISAKSTGYCGGADYSSSRCRATRQWSGSPMTHGWAWDFPTKMLSRWPFGRDLSHATGWAAVLSISGSGFSSAPARASWRRTIGGSGNGMSRLA